MTDLTPPPSVLYVGPETGERADRLARLRARGYTVQVANAGRAGLKRLAENDVDCVVLPGELPDMDVGHFRRRARELQPAVPLLVTGPIDPESFATWGESTPIAYVPNEEALAETVGSVVQERRFDAALDEQQRLKDRIRRITHDVVDAPDRETVEQHVYTHLNDHEGYQLVRVARYEAERDTVDLRIPPTGVVSLGDLGSLVGSDDPSFITRAITERTVTRVQSSVLTRGAAATAPAEGATRSDAGGDEPAPTTTTVAVPLTHGGTVHGLVLLVTTRTTGVDEVERELLADLGRILGYVFDRLQPEGVPDPEEFADVVVHELRNPLSIAQGYLDAMKTDGVDSEHLDKVDRALDRIEHVLTSELGLIRGQEIEEPTDRELADVAHEAWESVVTEDAELVIDESVEVRADDALLVGLLANLFDNAITHGGDEVTVRVGGLEDGFYVEDDGSGIPETDREALFERGYATGGGTGLGLAIVRRIADAHGWDVRVTDSVTGGARFEIVDEDSNRRGIRGSGHGPG